MATNSAGIRITQIGVSEPFAADYQYVFNSDWPSLAIAFNSNITVLAGFTGKIAHNLGFPPFVMAWYIVDGVSVGRFYGTTSFDSTYIYIDNSLSSSDVVVDIKCYNLDISKAQDYTLPKPPLFKPPYDPSTGIKVTKYGKSIASNDLRDFILHSRAQSPAVLTIMTQDAPSFVGPNVVDLVYTNPVNYTPWAYAFIASNSNSNIYKCFPLATSQNVPAFFQLGNRSVVSVGKNTRASLVVIRDPLVVPSTLRIVY